MMGDSRYQYTWGYHLQVTIPAVEDQPGVQEGVFLGGQQILLGVGTVAVGDLLISGAWGPREGFVQGSGIIAMPDREHGFDRSEA